MARSNVGCAAGSCSRRHVHTAWNALKSIFQTEDGCAQAENKNSGGKAGWLLNGMGVKPQQGNREDIWVVLRMLSRDACPILKDLS